jgi:hypothetical protein
MIRLLSYLVVLLLFLGISINAYAQYTTGSVQGVVLDSTGGAVPEAEVTLRNLGTNATRQFTTGSDGIYSFAAVLPGQYELAATAKGLSKAAVTILPSAGRDLSQNLTLSIETQRATINVGDAPLSELKSSDAQLDTTRNAIEVNDLPTQNRTVSSLVALEPGVQPMYTAGRGSLVKVAGAQTGLITANGGRPESSNVEIDFTDANDWEFGGIAVGDEPVPDLVAEYKVITSNAPAEYGIKSNGEIEYVTKGGSNSWHGDAYEYLQNDFFNARDFFDTSGKATRVDQNNYGFSSGGALVKNKTFLFGGWEQNKTIGGGFTTLAVVPSDAARATVTDPIVAALMGKYLPKAGSPTSDPSIGTVAQQFASPANSYQFLVKGDQQFSERHSASLRYFQATGTSVLTFPAFNTLAGFDSNLHNESRSANITDTFSFTPATVNQLRLGYSRSIAMLPPENGLVSPRFTIAGLVGFGALPYFPQGRTFNTYQGNDIFNCAAGRHLLKFGFDVRRIQDNSVNATNEQGSYVFASLPDFLAGRLSGWSQAFGPTALGFRSTLFSLFAQDDYKLRSDLTLNLGLRWEYQGALTESHGRVSVLDPTLSGSIGNAGSGDLGAFRIGNPAVNGNPTNVAPRVGLAWNPRSGKLVVRAGYGIYWDAFTFSPLAQGRTNAPLSYTFSQSGTASFIGANNFDALLAGTAPSVKQARAQLGSFGDLTNFGSLTTFNRNLPNAYSQQYNLTLEYHLTSSAVASLGYVGTKGTHLGGVLPINSTAASIAGATSDADELARLSQFQAAFQAENGPGNNRLDARFDQVNLITDWASSSYNALQAALRHSLRYGLTLQASYTWSKSIDNSSSSNPVQDANDNGFPQNATSLRSERAVSNFDVPHRVVVTAVWNLPFFRRRSDLFSTVLLKGWSFQSINTWQSGIPATILSGPVLGITDVNLDGNFIPNGDDNTRANCRLGGDFRLNNAGSLFTQTKYSQALLGNNGTCGRNTARLKSYVDFDWAFQKDFRLRESSVLGSGPWDLQFRGELYNVFNHPYLRPSGDAWRTVSSAGFGVLNTAGPSRNVQFALRLSW